MNVPLQERQYCHFSVHWLGGKHIVFFNVSESNGPHAMFSMVPLAFRFTDLIKVCFKYTADGKEVLDVTFITAVHTVF